jgi:hypothetical protein
MVSELELVTCGVDEEADPLLLQSRWIMMGLNRGKE